MTARVVVALVVVLLLTVGIHAYLWLRLVKGPGWPAPWPAVGTWTLVALAASVPLALIASRTLPRAAALPLSWIAYVWMGVLFLLVCLLLPAELVRLAHGFFGGEDGAPSPERRQFLSRGIFSVVALATTGLSAAALFTALREVAVQRVPVALRRLPAGLHGFRIVQLTDIHVGPLIDGRFIDQIVDTTNALEPDLIAITGDLVDGSVGELSTHVAALARLRARHGVFFVTGNHEYYSGADEWVSHLESLGIRVLSNEHVTLEHDGDRLVVAGVHDWSSEPFGHGPDLERALDGKDDALSVLLLAHQPKQIEEAARRGVDLQLSGHTHGGQIFPFNYLVRLQQPYVAGLETHRDTKLYVSRGTGYWGPPMRLGIPAEITHIELRPLA